MEYTVATLLLLIPFACIAAFAKWIKLRSDVTWEDKLKSWDVDPIRAEAITMDFPAGFSAAMGDSKRR